MVYRNPYNGYSEGEYGGYSQEEYTTDYSRGPQQDLRGSTTAQDRYYGTQVIEAFSIWDASRAECHDFPALTECQHVLSSLTGQEWSYRSLGSLGSNKWYPMSYGLMQWIFGQVQPMCSNVVPWISIRKPLKSKNAAASMLTGCQRVVALCSLAVRTGALGSVYCCVTLLRCYCIKVLLWYYVSLILCYCVPCYCVTVYYLAVKTGAVQTLKLIDILRSETNFGVCKLNSVRSLGWSVIVQCICLVI